VKRARLVTAALVIGSAALGFVPLAQASTSTPAPDAEGWYQPNPTCTTPAGCVTPGLDNLPVTPPVAPPALPVAPPTGPFPARTLHIGLAATTEVARAYLSYPLFALEQKITGGKLVVPLDVAPTSGSIAPETAKILVCAAIGDIKDVDGALVDPPQTDCNSSTPMTYVATPQPRLEANLGSIAEALGSSTGLALLPDATKAAQTDAWRVVFSARNRTDAGKTAPATLTLELEDPAVQPEPGAPEPVPTTPPTFGAVSPPVGTGFAPSPSVDPPVAAPPAVAPPAAGPVTATPQLVTVGYAYPIVWMLPLVFLLLGPLVGRALTKDLTPLSADLSSEPVQP
jgi:hypothetical protein